MSNKQKLFEIMARLDKTFKPKLNEDNRTGCFNDSIKIGTDQEIKEELSGKFYSADETPIGGDYDKGEYFEEKLKQALSDYIRDSQEVYGYEEILENIINLSKKIIDRLPQK